MTTAKPAEGSELRQRNTKSATNGSTDKKSPPKNPRSSVKQTTSSSSFVLDVLRAVAGIALVSTIASYATTQGESYTWGYELKKPWWLDVKQVQQAWLAAYDGSDPTKPILLGLNRTIYDVSASPQVYGPGGPYSALAAKDASRSYITTCFDPADDLVPYLGGVEEVYVPLWLSKKPPLAELENVGKGEIAQGKDAEDIIDEIHKKIGRKHIRRLQNEAYEKARERVRQQIKTWETMFEKKNYPIVGKVVGVDEEDSTKWRHLAFCEQARKLRPPMMETISEAFKAVGKEDKLALNMGRNMAMMKNAAKNAKTKKKYGKKKHGDIAMGSEDTKDEEKGYDHDSNEQAQAKIEDMQAGGKWFEKNKGKGMSPEDIMKYGPSGRDQEGANKARKLFEKERKRQNIPDAIPNEAVEETVKEGAEAEAEGVVS